MYLLDTHVLLWARLAPEKLSKNHALILQDIKTKKFVSTLSIWEISLKYSLSKLNLNGHTPEEFLDSLASTGLQIITPTTKCYAAFHQLPKIPNHKDPFDRMLIWQAMHSSTTLLSADKKFIEYRPKGLKLA